MHKKVEDKYKDLIESYVNIKPILSNLYKRNGNHHIEGILNEIRALNDHIARCYIPGLTDVQAFEELSKAEGHLKRLIYDSFKQLNIIFYDYTGDYERRFFGSHWISLNGGDFWSDYIRLRQLITRSVENAKLNESKDADIAFADYQAAYVAQESIYKMLESHKADLERGLLDKMVRVVSTNKSWLLSTVALAIIPALIWELYRHWTESWCWLTSIFKGLFHNIGQFLIGL